METENTSGSLIADEAADIVEKGEISDKEIREFLLKYSTYEGEPDPGPTMESLTLDALCEYRDKVVLYEHVAKLKNDWSLYGIAVSVHTQANERIKFIERTTRNAERMDEVKLVTEEELVAPYPNALWYLIVPQTERTLANEAFGAEIIVRPGETFMSAIRKYVSANRLDLTRCVVATAMCWPLSPAIQSLPAASYWHLDNALDMVTANYALRHHVRVIRVRKV